MHILLPHDAQEQRASRVHDGDIRGVPVAVVRLEGLDDTQEERMVGHGAHNVVGDPSGGCEAKEGGEGEQGVERADAALFQEKR